MLSTVYIGRYKDNNLIEKEHLNDQIGRSLQEVHRWRDSQLITIEFEFSMLLR